MGVCLLSPLGEAWLAWSCDLPPRMVLDGTVLNGAVLDGSGLYRGMSEFGLIMCLGNASWVVWSWPFVLPGWVALFFVTVNQVLVRLWARVTRGLS